MAVAFALAWVGVQRCLIALHGKRQPVRGQQERRSVRWRLLLRCFPDGVCEPSRSVSKPKLSRTLEPFVSNATGMERWRKDRQSPGGVGAKAEFEPPPMQDGLGRGQPFGKLKQVVDGSLRPKLERQRSGQQLVGSGFAYGVVVFDIEDPTCRTKSYAHVGVGPSVPPLRDLLGVGRRLILPIP